MDEEFDIDLEYLSMTYHGISDELLVDVYNINGADLDAAVDMFSQLEVEKHKILQANAKTVGLENGGHGAIEAGSNCIPFANTNNHAAVVDKKTIESQAKVFTRKSNEAKTVSPNLNLTNMVNATDKVKLLDMGNKKKPSRTSSSFFDRGLIKCLLGICHDFKIHWGWVGVGAGLLYRGCDFLL
ncbi:unnamed protein product [Lathyrus sativus]|nr:unnamed protein product [Lathyrus sativus]